ncbi:hypothetical protein ACFZBP_33970 [Streptomyces sp. NPDC008086]|uniref:hypothetical protein n=1 Tax=Streptomyces sp. NPDC008086 TaxID=3364807 RepID=UPI0036EC25EC
MTQQLSTRPQSVVVITVIVCILWGVLPQAQELITSLIVLNALWLAQSSIQVTGRGFVGRLAVQQRSTATTATGSA